LILPQVKLVGIPGSLRAASFSRATLIGLCSVLPDTVAMEICDLRLPLYNWASRPFGKSVLTNKPALAISISPAFTGGVRAHAQLNETLLAIPALVLGGRQVVIANIGNKIKNGILVDQPSLSFALTALQRMVGRVSSLRLIA
jgi:chromate reductase